MQIDISQIVKEAFEVQCEEFAKTVKDAADLICNESGDLENFSIVGRLIWIKPKGETLIIGDLHGDIASLLEIFKRSNFIERMSERSDAITIFLGDYGDRGENSKEVYYAVLRLKLLYPRQVILMRGNHEGPGDLLVSPHDLPLEFQMKFGGKWEEAYARIRELFECLYLAAFVEGRYLLVHGGLPTQAKTLLDMAFARENHPEKTFLEEILWSDPSDAINESCASPRGAGKLFGKNVTRELLKRLNADLLIRGHEPCREGFKIDHDGRVLTLFSRKGPPYFNEHGAYLELQLSEKYEKAQQLIQCIRKF